MISDYKSRKNEVLESSEKVEQILVELENIAKKAEMPSPSEVLERPLSDIRNLTEKVRADKFTLMVAGEAKSGKSTFINAYLGVELLPMDVKQCTSAIIEIKYGEEFYVQATYADGQKKKVVGDSEARDFLKKNAALDDEYRDIPVPTINSEIFVKSGLRAKNKDKKINILPSEVDDLLAAPEVQEANIYNSPEDEYNKKIRDYIHTRKDSWKRIVTKIEVFFPFKEELRGIEIIDSPGVCASGGVAEVTSNYIENADAIIFLKPLSGQALESTQFNQFMQNSSVTRNKNALFLVLTRAANVTSEELRHLESEAYKQFSNLDKGNILLIDSKAELYVKHWSGFNDPKAEAERLNQKVKLDDLVKSALLDAMSFGGVDFIQALKDKSRFEWVHNSLETFGRKAHYILLGQLLDSISKLYEKLLHDLNFQIDVLGDKAEDPTVLAKKIAYIKEEMDVINNKMYKGIDALVSPFIKDEDGVIYNTANKAVKDFEVKVASISENSNEAFDELEQQSKKKIDELKELTEELQRTVIAEFDKELVALTDKSTVHFQSLKPSFTEQTFEDIRKETKSKAIEKEYFDDGVTFKDIKSRSVYSRNKHYGLVKGNIMSRIKTIKTDMIVNLLDFIEKVRKRYTSELSKNADIKKRELDAIFEAKITAEETKKIISDLALLTEDISTAKSGVERIRGGITKNV